jgi:tetratricopeptide (TPR) repeat protein
MNNKYIKTLIIFIILLNIVKINLSADFNENENTINNKTSADLNYEKNSLYLLIEKHFEKNRYIPIKKLLDDFTNKYPNHQERKIYYYYAVIYEANSDNVQAISNYQKAISINPKYSQALNNLACVYHRLGRFSDAEELFLKAIEANPYSPFMNYNLGDLYFSIGKFEDAGKYILKSCKYKANFGEAYNKLGVVMLNLKKYPEAIDNFNNAIKFNSATYETYFYIAMANNNLGQTSQSVENLKKSIKIKNNYYNAYKELGKLYQMHLEYKNAIKFYFIAESINSEDSNLRIMISECYYAMQRYDDAVDILERLAKRDTNNKKISELLAKIKDRKKSESED